MKKRGTATSAENYTNESKIIKCYKRYAPLYDLLFGSVFQQGRRAIVKEMKAIDTKDVLEVGVGTGLMLPMYPSSCRFPIITLPALRCPTPIPLPLTPLSLSTR